MRRIGSGFHVARAGDASYFRERALQEQVAAQNAACEPARKRHVELATMYRFRAMMQPPCEPGLALDPAG